MSAEQAPAPTMVEHNPFVYAQQVMSPETQRYLLQRKVADGRASALEIDVLRVLTLSSQLEAGTQPSCREYDIENFYRADYERDASWAKRRHVAQGICFSCPLIQACQEDAIKRNEIFGIWGGLDFHIPKGNERFDQYARAQRFFQAQIDLPA